MRCDGLVLAAAVAVAVAGAAADRIPLDVWTFRSLNGSVRVDNASVPGSSHMHLLDAGVIEDPYFGYNELEYRWVVAETWVYEKTLTLGETAGAKLVFETLDGAAQVLVNGHSVAFTANSFRPFEFEVDEVLSKGSTNTITVIFTPATQYAFDAVSTPLQALDASRWIIYLIVCVHGRRRLPSTRTLSPRPLTTTYGPSRRIAPSSARLGRISAGTGGQLTPLRGSQDTRTWRFRRLLYLSSS